MAVAALFRKWQFSKGLSQRGEVEKGIVSEAACATRRSDEFAFGLAAESLECFPIPRQRYDANISAGMRSCRKPPQLRDQGLVIGFIIRVFMAGSAVRQHRRVPGGEDARRSSKLVYFKA